jgi:prophage antirepressor-like protein
MISSAPQERIVLAVVGSFESTQVRMVGPFTTRAGTEAENGWVLADVADVLGIGNPRDWARALDDDEKGVALTDTLGGPQELVVVTEPGLYKLLARSRKPEAKRFDRWVRHEVLPTIRKSGGYGITHQHSSDLATLVGDAVAGAIRPALLPMQQQLDALSQKVNRPRWADTCDQFQLPPLDQWMVVGTLMKAPAMPGLYRIQWKGDRTLYIGKADGRRGLYGRLTESKHECLQYLQALQAPYRVTVCPTPFSGRKLATAEDALRADLQADWEYGDRIGEWRKIQEIRQRASWQPSFF